MLTEMNCIWQERSYCLLVLTSIEQNIGVKLVGYPTYTQVDSEDSCETGCRQKFAQVSFEMQMQQESILPDMSQIYTSKFELVMECK